MNIRNALIVVLLPVSMVGCGTLGNSDYSCPGMPKGVVCKSPVEVYEMTHNADRLDGNNAEEAEKGGVRKEVRAATNAALARVPGQLSTGRSMPKDSQPVLEPARVMRVWVAPWIDAKQDLHMPGYVFTEVTPRRWTFGESTALHGKPLVPVQQVGMGGEGDSTVEVGEEAKLLTPKGLIQGLQQQQQGQPRGAVPTSNNNTGMPGLFGNPQGAR